MHSHLIQSTHPIRKSHKTGNEEILQQVYSQRALTYLQYRLVNPCFPIKKFYIANKPGHNNESTQITQHQITQNMEYRRGQHRIVDYKQQCKEENDCNSF